MRFPSLVRAARIYSQVSSPIAHVARRFIARAARLMSPECPVALDIGCGTCPYRDIVSTAFHTETYIGIDLAPTDGTQLVADARFLPIASSSVDLVVSFDVIQHVPESHLMLDEIARVLCVNGYVLITFPFLYAECDFHDFQRWTLEGIDDALMRRGLTPVLLRRRGGALFALFCGLNWVVQHIIPGQRKSWRHQRSARAIFRSVVVSILTLPTLLLGWIALMVDSVVPIRGVYMGGAVLAKKIRSADTIPVKSD